MQYAKDIMEWKRAKKGQCEKIPLVPIEEEPKKEEKKKNDKSKTGKSTRK